MWQDRIGKRRGGCVRCDEVFIFYYLFFWGGCLGGYGMGMVCWDGVLCCEVFVWVWCNALALGWCFKVDIGFGGNGDAWCCLYLSGLGANDGRAGHYI